jgi:hypothetical protein
VTRGSRAENGRKVHRDSLTCPGRLWQESLDLLQRHSLQVKVISMVVGVGAVILPRSIPHASWGIGWGADTALPRLPYAASGTRASRAASRPSTMAALVTVVVLTVAAAVVAAAATATTTTATTTTTTTTTTSPRGPVVDGTAGASSPGCDADSEHGPRPWRASATWTAPSHRPSIYLPPPPRLLPALSNPGLD